MNRLARSKVNPFEAVEVPEPTAELPTESSTGPASVTVPTEFFSKLFTMFAEKMNEGIEKSIAAARQAPEDPIKKKQAERAAEAKFQAEKAYWEQLQNRFAQCSHLREDMTSCICWSTQSDGKYRGYCPHCGCVFSPIRNECASQEIFDKYKDVVRIPTSRGNAVHYVS